MLATLKSEFRKLLSIRSTYILTSLVFVGTALIAYFLLGREQEAFAATNPNMLYDSVYTVIGLFATFSAIIGILHITHEYRYSTINYTLTASRSRLRVILAKTTVLTTYALVVGAIVAFLGYFLAKAGLASVDATLVSQQTDWWAAAWQLGAYTIGYTLVGLLLGLLLRSVVGAIVVFFLFPVVEQMLSLLLKENTKFLPFNALEAVAATTQFRSAEMLTHTAALGVFALYFVGISIIATILFVRRDAS